MRHRQLPSAALALGAVVLLDVLRVWLPSIITIFGRAAETPAELLGAFALGWFVLALAAPTLVRRLGPRPVGLAAAAVLAGARLALTAAPGGRIQLWLACAGLLAGLVWLAAAAAEVTRPVPGLALGLAAGAVGHALLGTEDLVWRGGVPGWTSSVLVVAVFLAAQTASHTVPVAAPAPSGVRAWWVAGPLLLLTGQLALAPALWHAAASYRHGSPGFPGLGLPPDGVPALPVLAIGLFLAGAFIRLPGWPARMLWPAALLVGAALFAADRAGWLAPAVLLAAAGAGGCFGLLDTGPGSSDAGEGRGGGDRAGRRAYAAVGGMLSFAILTVGYYAAYDLGYPNGWVPVASALLVATVAAAAPPAARPPAVARRPGSASVLPEPAPAWATVGLTLLAAIPGGLDRPVSAAERPAAPPAAVRVVAYNIRMGFGLDGRLDPDALARAVTGSRPHVVLLSEVDRGWLLNGGHDTLTLLARRLGMPYVFAPAADPLWGDAVLSRFPVRSGETRPLAARGAPTGAQALGVTLDLGGRDLAVVATHLQPPPGREPVAQAREVAAFATRYAAGRPLILAGDLNTEPDAPAFAEFTGAGLVDALAAARPLPTSPADRPRNQIDHVLVSPGLTSAEVAAPRATASDHLPVAVTLTLP